MNLLYFRGGDNVDVDIARTEPQRRITTTWLTTKNELSFSHDTTAFIPFGMGPRFCPGRNLALLQIKEVLSMLIKNFDFELCDQRLPVKEKLAFAMMPRNLNVRLRERV